jgi:hypothetical protein
MRYRMRYRFAKSLAGSHGDAEVADVISRPTRQSSVGSAITESTANAQHTTAK